MNLDKPWKWKRHYRISRLKHLSSEKLREEYRWIIEKGQEHKFIDDPNVLKTLSQIEEIFDKRRINHLG